MTMVLTTEFRLSLLLLVGISSLMLANTASAWQNSYDQPHHIECGRSASIAEVKSQHNNHHEDRQWEYRCRTVPNGARLGSCRWHDNVNGMDGLLAFRCPGRQVITGVRSHHNNHHEDRVFSFRCCYLQGKRLDRCHLTGYINEYDRLMDYRAPHGYVIVGFTSVHNNHREDRIWKVEICHVS